jgi:hypothetical protein
VKIPSTLTFEGQTWRVRYKRLEKDTVGSTVYRNCTIYIDHTKAKSEEARQQVFVHELLHLVLPGPSELPLIHIEKLILKLEGPLFRALASFEGEAALPASRVRRARRTGPRAVESVGTSGSPSPPSPSGDPTA